MLMVPQALVIAEGVIMIIGNSLWYPSVAANTLTVGSATHSVGYHSPPNLGPEVASYDGSSQIMLEKVC